MRLALALAACTLLAGCYYPYPYPASTASSGQPVVWSNPEAGTSGTATAQPAGGDTCREYQTTVTLDGRPQPAWGVVCRPSDGSWRLVR